MPLYSGNSPHMRWAMRRASGLPPPAAPPKRRSRSGATRKAAWRAVGEWGMYRLFASRERRIVASVTKDSEYVSDEGRLHLRGHLQGAATGPAELQAPAEVVGQDELQVLGMGPPVLIAGLPDGLKGMDGPLRPARVGHLREFRIPLDLVVVNGLGDAGVLAGNPNGRALAQGFEKTGPDIALDCPG